MINLQANIESAGGIYKRYARSLEKLGILKFEDFLYYPPFRYEDYSLVSKIDSLQEGETVTVRGEVVSIKNIYTRRFRTVQTAVIKDETGNLEIVWFNQPFLTKSIKEGDRISLSGKISQNKNNLTMQSPDYELQTEETIHTGRLVPIYPETRGVSSKWIRRQVWNLLHQETIKDFLPDEIKRDEKLLDLSDALYQIHFPKDAENAKDARQRLSFDELLLVQTRSTLVRREWSEKTRGNKFEIKKYEDQINKFIKSLPFELTNAQKNAVSEMLEDVGKNRPMNRLLEGDVGSGKTVVAAILAFVAYLNGFKSIFMAPTEILATQHFETIKKLLNPFGLKIALATGQKKISLDNFDILIGTHAVLSDRINTDKVGLVIIDEQQRFGVEQRGLIRKKGNNPHLLTMTATPIPRTVALTLYGNLDLSVLDEMPKGRLPIKTWLVPNTKRNSAYAWIEQEVKKNKTQAFIICPFIEESESMISVKAAKKEFELLKKNIFKNLTLGLLHGKQKVKERDEILDLFKKGKIDILVATPVVEVGIDIPGASIIVIEAAERFGLSQLHQLRGRVGRRGQQAYCLLFSESKTSTSRLKYMEKTQIGAQLAEFDLKLRGAGEVFGTRQHGTSILKIASFSDFDLIAKTKKIAEELTSDLDKYPNFKEKIKQQKLQNISQD